MHYKNKIVFGSILAIIGALGIVFGLVLDLSELARHWSFVIGFFTGLSAGLGSVLSVAGFISRNKRERKS